MSESTDRAERVERPRVAALDEILGEALPVLDDGFVRVVDYMGDDERDCSPARGRGQPPGASAQSLTGGQSTGPASVWNSRCTLNVVSLGGL